MPGQTQGCAPRPDVLPRALPTMASSSSERPDTADSGLRQVRFLGEEPSPSFPVLSSFLKVPPILPLLQTPPIKASGGTPAPEAVTFGHAEDTQKSQQLGRDGQLGHVQGKDTGAEEAGGRAVSRVPHSDGAGVPTTKL